MITRTIPSKAYILTDLSLTEREVIVPLKDTVSLDYFRILTGLEDLEAFREDRTFVQTYSMPERLFINYSNENKERKERNYAKQ